MFLSFFYEDDSGIDSSIKSTAETRLKDVVEINGKDAIRYRVRQERGSENPMKVSTQAELDEFLREFDEALSEPAPEEHWVEDVVLEDFDKGSKCKDRSLHLGNLALPR